MILVLRSKQDILATSKILDNIGITNHPEEIFLISYRDIKIIDPISCIIITSKHATSFSLENKNQYFVTSSKAAKEILNEKGFYNIKYISPPATKIIHHIKSMLPKKLSILYLRGNKVSYDIASQFEKHNFISKIAYEISYSNSLSEQTIILLKKQKISSVLFSSANIAKTFIKLLQSHNLQYLSKNLYTFSISSRVDKMLESLIWKNRFISKNPDIDSLYHLILSHKKSIIIYKN